MRSKFVLVLALVMGMITTVLFFQYMKQFDAEKAATSNTVEVIVAKERIEKNARISANMIERVSLPEKSIHPKMMKSDSLVVGKIATSMIEKGEPIMSHRLVSELEEDLYVSRKVKEGYRAVSVGVNINQTALNLIEPEDDVDVIYSRAKKAQNYEKEVETVVLLKKARVLAVGRKLKTPEDSKEPYVEYSNVTLELKPEDAFKLVNASEQGNLHFILHKRPVREENVDTTKK
ncbi:pilus assembly protein CpaB [Bacillus sp. cl95]|uniref:Flp pilus assembly protein CpaB n=1 Tax=Bacillus sp. UNCCL13 TaxID=1502772 RepID=UPI0008DF642B|nr:Flp pilus assembly protein CpaB [Bacillus sp. UNCCL13]SFA79346.1 pilus assembly protein CpaB [Bacillus sp. UNCCL13]SFQ69334.1 pilus assembly protein CpaB [Bacillus sp. cl95]